MIQLAIIFMCFFSSAFAGNGEVLGSRVITSSSGKVGPMYFKSTDRFSTFLRRVQTIEVGEQLTIENDNCIMNGSTVGSPCKMQPDQTVITFNEVPNYDYLILSSKSEIYTVYFAKNCKFPTPPAGEIIVEKSIPLYRFLDSKTE
ncbi:unnamed protein product [Hymenolepis diminuta]|uniref:DUF5727 domain-containing protein n=1 Tax=Hymenolepis diminuta TaxID=6216 RepID=A0A564Y0K5_HYMDI|nr:unnamed protein product [Hymenolepis diminuta]